MPIRWVLFDWGDTLMPEDGGPPEQPMALWPSLRTLDGAREVLAALARRHRLGVATNASVSDRAQIERALERVALLPFVSELFCFRQLGVKKAQPLFWDIVVERLAVGRDEIVMVGDNLEDDVLAPRRSGIASVWLNRRRAALPPGIEVTAIERLDELPALIDALERARRR